MIERLVQRDVTALGLEGGTQAKPPNYNQVGFLGTTPNPYGTFSVAGSLVLHRQILSRPWIPSEAISTAQGVMESAIVPSRQWLVGQRFEKDLAERRRWNVVLRRAREIRISVDSKNQGTWPDNAVDAGAKISLNGQRLDVAVVALLHSSKNAKPIAMEDAYALLLALLMSTRDLLSAVASSLTPDLPTSLGSWKGWIRRSRPFSWDGDIGGIVDLSRWMRAPVSSGTDGALPESTTGDRSIGSYDRLVREWLMVLLANNGVMGHEADIESLRTPEWFRE
jgi:hypothetical protein